MNSTSPAIHIESYRESNSSKTFSESYTRRELGVFFIVVVLLFLGFLLRTWRMLREGLPIYHDGYDSLRYIKRIYFDGWIQLPELPWIGPGFFFILNFGAKMIGLPEEALYWSIYLLPQIIGSLQLLIFFLLARRLTRSRSIAILSLLFVVILGQLVNWDQNSTPELIVRG
ncbi:MAG: hypothetical protein U9O98_04825, partial [Asgard group archaeon]|nr:hypothetical protein [Asgard group archaeon]